MLCVMNKTEDVFIYDRIIKRSRLKRVASMQRQERYQKRHGHAPFYLAQRYTPPPPASHNGGLFTGEPFLPGAPWRSIPVVPDSSYMIHVTLRSADPPPEALYQYPGAGHRPGNNYSPMPGVTPVTPPEGPYPDLLCTPELPRHELRRAQQTPRFSKFAYL